MNLTLIPVSAVQRPCCIFDDYGAFPPIIVFVWWLWTAVSVNCKPLYSNTKQDKEPSCSLINFAEQYCTALQYFGNLIRIMSNRHNINCYDFGIVQRDPVLSYIGFYYNYYQKVGSIYNPCHQGSFIAMCLVL